MENGTDFGSILQYTSHEPMRIITSTDMLYSRICFFRSLAVFCNKSPYNAVFVVNFRLRSMWCNSVNILDWYGECANER